MRCSVFSWVNRPIEQWMCMSRHTNQWEKNNNNNSHRQATPVCIHRRAQHACTSRFQFIIWVERKSSKIHDNDCDGDGNAWKDEQQKIKRQKFEGWYIVEVCDAAEKFVQRTVFVCDLPVVAVHSFARAIWAASLISLENLCDTKRWRFNATFRKYQPWQKNNLIFFGQRARNETKRKKKTGRAKARTYLQCILAEECLYRERKWNDMHLA